MRYIRWMLHLNCYTCGGLRMCRAITKQLMSSASCSIFVKSTRSACVQIQCYMQSHTLTNEGLIFSYGLYFRKLTCVQKLNPNENSCTILQCMCAHRTIRKLNPNVNLKYEILSCLKFPSLWYYITHTATYHIHVLV